MKTDDFWLLIDRTRRSSHDEAPMLAALTAELQGLREPAIIAFEQQLRDQMARLDQPRLRDVAEQLWVLRDDGWRHLRAWCVSRGLEFVQRLQANPSRIFRELADGRSGPFDPPDGELFLYCAEYARVARAKAVA
jgi:hypothetical protein